MPVKLPNGEEITGLNWRIWSTNKTNEVRSEIWEQAHICSNLTHGHGWNHLEKGDRRKIATRLETWCTKSSIKC